MEKELLKLENIELKQHRSEIKAGSHITLSTTLLIAVITIFTFIITINAGLLKNDLFLSIQLSTSIVMILYQTLARARVSIYYDKKINEFGTFLYGISLGFFINIFGILLSDVVSLQISLVYFITSIIIFVSYSCLVIRHHKINYNVWKYKKEIITLAIILFLGLFKVVGLYH